MMLKSNNMAAPPNAKRFLLTSCAREHTLFSAQSIAYGSRISITIRASGITKSSQFLFSAPSKALRIYQAGDLKHARHAIDALKMVGYSENEIGFLVRASATGLGDDTLSSAASGAVEGGCLAAC